MATREMARSAARITLAVLALWASVTDVFAGCDKYEPESKCQADFDPDSGQIHKCIWKKEPVPGKCVQGTRIRDFNAMQIFTKFGDRTTDVLLLQVLLNANGFKVETDNKFGLETLKALTEFQQKNNLPKTGTGQIVAQKTLGALVAQKR